MSDFFSKNLKYLRTKKDIDQQELAELLGRKSGSTVSEWEKGTYTPKSGTLSDLAMMFNVSLNDLMRTDLSEKPNNLTQAAPLTIKIPILGKIACGHPITAEENIKGYIYESPDNLPSGNLMCLEAFGESMYPTIPHGSFVTIREQPDVETGQIAAVLLNGDTEATLKRVKKQGNTLLLMPDNPNYDPIIVDENNPARIIGKAVRITRDL